MNSPTNFECHILDDDAIISFDQQAFRIPITESESLQHRFDRHVFYGDGGFEIGDVEIDMEDAFILNEVLCIAFEEGYALAFGEEDER